MFRVLDSPPAPTPPFDGLGGLAGAGFLFTDIAPLVLEPPPLEPLPDGADIDGDVEEADEDEEGIAGAFNITCPFCSLQIGIIEA